MDQPTLSHQSALQNKHFGSNLNSRCLGDPLELPLELPIDLQSLLAIAALTAGFSRPPASSPISLRECVLRIGSEGIQAAPEMQVRSLIRKDLPAFRRLAEYTVPAIRHLESAL